MPAGSGWRKDVGPFVQAGRLAEVQAYCLCDVAQTAAVFLRVQLLRGELPRAGYLGAMRRLIDSIRSDERLAPVAATMDETPLARSMNQPPYPQYPPPQYRTTAAAAGHCERSRAPEAPVDRLLHRRGLLVAVRVHPLIYMGMGLFIVSGRMPSSSGSPVPVGWIFVASGSS